jgi:hypothetical protein
MKVIDGKQVYAMNPNPNEFASISTLRNQIAGKYDKYDTNSATDAFVKGLGEEVTSSIAKAASLSGGGLILNVEDIRSRKDIDPATKDILYKFTDSENQFIKGSLANPFDRLSVLTNSKKFAPNGQQYGFTYKEEEAKANPNKILLKVDPNSGQPTPQFSEEQMKVSEDFMRTELRAKYTRKEELKPTPQAQLQERRAPTTGEIDEKNRIADARNFAENMAIALTGKDPVAIGNAVKYLANKSGKLVDRTATGIVVKNADGTNASTYNFLENGRVTDPKKLTKAMVSAFGTSLPEDKIVQFANQFIGSNQLETKTSAAGFEAAKPKPAAIKVTPDLFTIKSEKSSERLRGLLPSNFTVTDEGGTFGNDVKVTAPNGKTYTYNANMSTEKAAAEKKALDEFIRINNVAGTKGELDD